MPARALIFIFNATEAGHLTVELPRQIIDSTKDGKDKPYLVFVGNLESGVKRSKANEVQNNNTTRTLTINFAKGENKVQITGTFFVENKSSYVPINPFDAFSPLMQFKKGIDAQDVICKESFVLVTKYDITPACVKPTTVDKLVERGWTDPHMTYFCSLEYLPVCGIDDVTYGNLCFMEKSGVELKHDGECKNFMPSDYELDETEFLQIKNNMENVGYHICDIQLDENMILIELNWIFEGSEPEKMILQKIPSNVRYEIKYLDGYADYFISKDSVYSCGD